MSLSTLHSRRILILAFMTMGLSYASSVSRNSLAADTSSDFVSTRTSADLSTIIGQLEAKTKALGDGAWTLSAGPQNKPDDHWLAASVGSEWCCSMVTEGGSNTAATTIYSDGIHNFLLPDAERFESEALQRGQVGEIRQSLWLVLANLHPREFIEQYRGLRFAGEEMVEGSVCAHLTNQVANPFAAVTGQPYSSKPLPSIDIWIDVKRHAICKTHTWDFNGHAIDTQVATWDDFGTRGDWPKTVICKTEVTALVPTGNSVSTMIATIGTFKSGFSGPITSVRAAVASHALYSAPAEDVKAPLFYRKLLANNPQDQSAKVGLAQSEFATGSILEGLARWRKLRVESADVGQREWLSGVLSPLAGQALERSAAHENGAEACADLLIFLDETLTPTQYRAQCEKIFATWLRMRGSKAANAQLAAHEGSLLDRLGQSGSPKVFAGLIALANNRREDDQLISPHLQRAAMQPLAGSGLKDSQLSYLVVAAMRQKDIKRAGEYLAFANWDSRTEPGVRKMASVMAASVENSRSLLNDQDVTSDSAGLFASLSTEPVSDDLLDASEAQAFVSRSVADWLDRRVEKVGTVDAVVSVMEKVAKLPHSAAFMDLVLHNLVGRHTETPSWLNRCAGPSFEAYGRILGVPEYACQSWMQLSEIYSPVGQLLNVRVERLNKALTAAPDDLWRTRVIYRLAYVYSSTREFTKAIDSVKGVAALVHDLNSQKQIEKLLDILLQNRSADDAHLANSARQSKDNRANGELSFMQRQLDQATTSGKSPQEIASIKTSLENIRLSVNGSR